MSAPSVPRLGLQRGQRLRAGCDFIRLKESGQRWVQGCLILNWQPASDPRSGSRIGVVTSKTIGNAVCRNRARRLLKEVFRRHQHAISVPVDLILVARKSIVGKGFDAVEADYLRSLKGARLGPVPSRTVPAPPR
ncbi:MAG: ribonuclease P protein component [Verrucomicrobiota bacterium]